MLFYITGVHLVAVNKNLIDAVIGVSIIWGKSDFSYALIRKRVDVVGQVEIGCHGKIAVSHIDRMNVVVYGNGLYQSTR